MNHYGMGADPLAAITGDLTDRVTAALLPKLSEIVARTSQAAEPTIRRVIQEDVLPPLGLFVILGFGLMAVTSAGIGSYYATKARRRAA